MFKTYRGRIVTYGEQCLNFTDLEGEMYQLSHLLTEQSSLLNLLANSTIVSDQTANTDKETNDVSNDKVDNVNEEKRIQKLLNIMERVENCTVSTNLFIILLFGSIRYFELGFRNCLMFLIVNVCMKEIY